METENVKRSMLFIINEFPYPVNDGGRMRSFFFLKQFAETHDITLLSLLHHERDLQYSIELRKICREVHTIPKGTCNYYKKQNVEMGERFKSWIQGNPWTVRDRYSEEMQRKLKFLPIESYDVILVRFLETAQYFFNDPYFKPVLDKVIVDVDDIEIKKYQRQIQLLGMSYEKIRGYVELSRLKRYYRNLSRLKDCIVCSEIDKAYLLSLGIQCNVHIIPNVIDSTNIAKSSTVCDSHPEAPTMLFCGAFFGVNVDGALWFCHEVLPLIRQAIPDAKIRIVGKNSRQKLQALMGSEGIDVVGEVPDVGPYYDEAQLVVVPLRAGSGTRIKILEAMAYGRPVVSTTVGAEGIDAENGIHLLIADTPKDFSQSCINLLRNESHCRRFSENGLKLVKEKYDSAIVKVKLEELLDHRLERSVVELRS